MELIYQNCIDLLLLSLSMCFVSVWTVYKSRAYVWFEWIKWWLKYFVLSFKFIRFSMHTTYCSQYAWLVRFLSFNKLTVETGNEHYLAFSNRIHQLNLHKSYKRQFQSELIEYALFCFHYVVKVFGAFTVLLFGIKTVSLRNSKWTTSHTKIDIFSEVNADDFPFN